MLVITGTEISLMFADFIFKIKGFFSLVKQPVNETKWADDGELVPGLPEGNFRARFSV